MKTAFPEKMVSNIPVLASVCFDEVCLPFLMFSFSRIVRKIPINVVPKMLQYREYIQNPSPDEGKWRQFYFEAVFSWNILPKYFAS